MNAAQDDYVHEKTRHIVAREALKRASSMIHAWHTETQENNRLAKKLALQLAIGLLILVVVCITLFIHF